MDFYELTHGGNAHPANEDAVASWPCDDGLVFAVADGIGAEGGGNVASGLALEISAGRWPSPRRACRS